MLLYNSGMKNYTLGDIVKNIQIYCGEKVGVGVSGGVDSMVLLCALLEKRKNVNFNLFVVHVNHGLRAEESDRDELFVKSFCEKNSLNFLTVSVDVRGNKQKNKLTEEESARVLRYNEFERVINEKKLNKFFLAHHANDQAETILMHLFRGSGTNGAIGMNSSRFMRPMLTITRNEILNIAKENKINFVEDSTNAQNICNRNIVRNDILPKVENVYPGVVSAICKFGENLKTDQDFIESNVPYNKIKLEKDSVKFDIALLDSHKAISYRLIMRAFNLLGVYSDILSVHIDAVINLKQSINNSVLHMPHDVFVVKEYDKIVFYKGKKNTNENVYEFATGSFDFGDYVVNIENVNKNEISFGDGSLYACVDGLDGLVFRTAKENDVFKKLGSSGSKKLVDYFTDKKIPLIKRKQVPLLAYNNEVLVVIGFDISDKVKVDKKSSKIVRLTCLTKE